MRNKRTPASRAAEGPTVFVSVVRPRGACQDCGAVKVSGVCPDCAGLMTLPVRDARGRFVPGMAAFLGSAGSKDRS